MTPQEADQRATQLVADVTKIMAEMVAISERYADLDIDDCSLDGKLAVQDAFHSIRALARAK